MLKKIKKLIFKSYCFNCKKKEHLTKNYLNKKKKGRSNPNQAIKVAFIIA